MPPLERLPELGGWQIPALHGKRHFNPLFVHSADIGQM
jgi:hypothetical protein